MMLPSRHYPPPPPLAPCCALTRAVRAAQVVSVLSPGALLSPRSVRVLGVLAESDDLLALNEANEQWLGADTGGLEYGPANEMLWRHNRPAQVGLGGGALVSLSNDIYNE